LRVVAAGCVVFEGINTVGVLLLPVVLNSSAWHRSLCSGRGCAVEGALAPSAVLKLPVVLLKSALKPIAVLPSPVVRLKSALSFSRVAARIASVSYLGTTARTAGKRKAAEHKWDAKRQNCYVFELSERIHGSSFLSFSPLR
jgi:hypothetical protein